METSIIRVNDDEGNGLLVIPGLFARALWSGLLLLLIGVPGAAQRMAILTPDRAESDKVYAAKLEAGLETKFKIVDNSLSDAAYSALRVETPYNLTTEKASTLGTSIGCDFYILLRSATLRRSSFKRSEYYESYAAIYVISTRTGRLVQWKLSQFEALTPAEAEILLMKAVPYEVREITRVINSAAAAEIAELAPPAMEEPPAEDSAGSKSFRAPIPFRRIKPEYTAQAALYDVSATIEILVDLDVTGTVQRTLIVRWAGFGLDESVAKTVREMNWRPAERKGRALPMRFLLRYNFKKIEKLEKE
ncbi:MAG: energy transducer TonB [Pyrinomonadaceae bacterium]